jgi:hypothetical protein
MSDPKQMAQNLERDGGGDAMWAWIVSVITVIFISTLAYGYKTAEFQHGRKATLFKFADDHWLHVGSASEGQSLCCYAGSGAYTPH